MAVEALGEEGVRESPKELGSALRTKLRAIHRLAAACLGDGQ